MSCFGSCRKLFLGILILCILPGAAVHAQAESAQTENAVTLSGQDSPQLLTEEKVLEMDISTSTLTELSAWCRRLDLSDSGVRETLMDRLRVYYGLPKPENNEAAQNADSIKSIIIESARSTEYFTLDAVNEEYARLSGAVKVVLKDGDTTHHLSADTLVFNRTRNTLSASGNVEYSKEGADSDESFKGQSLSINLDDWAGTFIGGASERSLSGEDTAYRFAGTVISRDSEDVTLMRKAVISNADSENPYWSIAASKLWLLPGSEWAIFNAVLKVGEIPLLYIPFFYLPGDELIFHPVLGYRSREGSYVQTTTYLSGRPKATESSENSITKILGSGADTERVREGLFLRSTGKRIKDPDEISFSLLFDVYTNLGYYAGAELSMPRKGILGNLDLSLGLGLTRDVYQVDTESFTPFKNFDGSSDWNRSRFFDIETAFRYRIRVGLSLKGKQASITLDFPFYSDPFVNADFLNRSEDMDWFNMIKQGAALEDTSETAGVLGSYAWKLSGTISPDISFLAPFVSSVTVPSINSTLSFGTRNAENPSSAVAPDRTFFYPNKFTLLSLSASVSGKPLSLGSSSVNKNQNNANTAEQDNPVLKLAEPRSPWNETGTDTEESMTDQNVDSRYNLYPPLLSQQFDTAIGASDSSFSLSYKISPSSASVLQFRSSSENWQDAEDVSWDEVSSVLNSIDTSSTLTASLKGPADILSSTLDLNAITKWQDYSYMNEDSEDFDTEASRDAALLRTYKSNNFTSTYEYEITAKPLSANEIWGSSNLKYKLEGLVAKSAFVGDVDNPDWDTEYGSWTKDDLKSHSASLNVIALFRDKQQNLSLSTELPPRDAVLSAGTIARFGISQTSLDTKIVDPYDDPEYKPLSFKETLTFSSSKNFVQTLIYDPELKELTSFISILKLGNFNASYFASYKVPYMLEEGLGWRLSNKEASLQPERLSMSYTKNDLKKTFFGNLASLNLNLNSNLKLDLQRYTNSSFTFNFGSTIKINDFMDITLSTESENGLIFRYIQDWPIWPVTVDIPGERNPFIDLVNSFRFDNDLLRKNSGFKLKKFKLDATHYMGDWNAVLGIELAPYLDKTQTPARYEFNTEISFLVQWIPISEIKTDVYSDKDGFVYK